MSMLDTNGGSIDAAARASSTPAALPGSGAPPIPIGEGDAEIERMLAAMIAVVREANEAAPGGSPLVRERAALMREQAHRAREPLQHALYWLLRTHFRFEEDPPNTERVRTPDESLARLARDGWTDGDCDDLAMLAGALLLAAGERPVAIVMARSASATYEHVYYGVLRPDARAFKPGEEVPPHVVTPFDPQERTPAGAWTQPQGRVRCVAF